MERVKILIVEDEYIVARMLQKALTELGYDVAGLASNGPDAIDLVKKTLPALILLDIRLSGPMDGIETARVIGEQYHIPVVYLTAHSDDQTFSRAIKTALYGYLIKPVSINALRTTIGVALEKFRIGESLRQANRKLSLLSSITRHDIANTLTAMMTAVDLARAKTTDPAFLEHLENEDQCLARIRRQIEFTRDYDSLGDHAPAWQDLQALIGSTALLFRPQGVRVLSAVEGILVFADPLFEKVIYNLTDNAVRHGRTVSTVKFSSEERSNDLILSCEDDGIGIPPEEKEKIFGRGYGKNTGLGLFLVREILGITGLTIEETGMPGKGARFEIRIPQGRFRK